MDHSNSLSNFNKLKSSSNGNFQRSTLHKPTASSQQRVLRRSLSQKDLLHSHDGYSVSISTSLPLFEILILLYIVNYEELYSPRPTSSVT